MNLFYVVVSSSNDDYYGTTSLVSVHITEQGAKDKIKLLQEQNIIIDDINEALCIWESNELDITFPWPSSPTKEQKLEAGAVWDRYKWTNKAEVDYSIETARIAKLRGEALEQKRKELYSEKGISLNLTGNLQYFVETVPGGL